MAELDEAERVYERQWRGRGLRFRAAGAQAGGLIRQMPTAFGFYRKTKARMFVFKKFPYLVIYSDQPDHVRIVAIHHAKRRSRYWHRRLPAPETTE